MNYTEISNKIRSHAEALLESKRIPSLLSEIGQLYFTGSYALDLMTWNDIDMQLAPHGEGHPIDALMRILGCYAKEADFIEGRIIHFREDYKPQWPRGYCQCLKFNSPAFGGLWKLDLWILSQEDLAINRALMEQLKKALTSQTRDLIIELKFKLMGATGRVPKKGSHWLYQAVLIHGLSDKKSIFDFLHNKGVVIENGS